MRLRRPTIERMKEWIEQGAGAHDAGFTLNSCPYDMAMAKWCWRMGWEGMEPDLIIERWKEQTKCHEKSH
jgi:hypothetical protein